MRDLWIEWDWRREPEAPRGWTEPERRVVVVDGLSAGALQRLDAAADAMAAVEQSDARGVVAICIESPEVLAAHTVRAPRHQRHPRNIPALRVERQADLSAEAVRALHRVQARRRALVVVPREAIDLRNGRADVWNLPTAQDASGHGVEWVDPGPNYIGIDLVIVRGPTGPDAWPMHPAWVRSIRDQCAAAGVAFAFLGWGAFVPDESAPPEINGCSKRRNAWIVGGCKGPRPDPEGTEETWWGDPITGDGKVITEWGALAEDGTYWTGWTPWRDETVVYRVGPDRSGRLLDGREHLALPEGL